MPDFMKILKMNPNHGPDGLFAKKAGGPGTIGQKVSIGDNVTIAQKTAEKALAKLEAASENGQVSLEKIGFKVESANQIPSDVVIPKSTKIIAGSPKSFRATQDDVDMSGMKKYLSGKGTSKDLPLVIRHPDGKLYIQDGHHRLAAQAAAGTILTRVNVVTIKKISTDDNGKMVIEWKD